VRAKEGREGGGGEEGTERKRKRGEKECRQQRDYSTRTKLL